MSSSKAVVPSKEPTDMIVATPSEDKEKSKSSTIIARRPEDVKARIDHHANAYPPLDYSFQEMKSLKELPEHEPINFPAPEDKNQDIKLKDAGDESKVVPITWDKSRLTGVKLAYNQLTDLDGLDQALSFLMNDPIQQLQWIDLSHNMLTHVEERLLKYKNLSVIYLHGNKIRQLSDVRRLHNMENLSKLTLHGNPLYVEKESGLQKARALVIHALRNTSLKSLDHIALTNHERTLSAQYAVSHRMKKQNSALSPKKNHTNKTTENTEKSA